MTKDHLSLIIGMAARDNKVEENELRVIHMLAKASGLNKNDVEELLKKPHQIDKMPSASSTEERFELLYHLIQMMKADGQVFKSEISFCEYIAEQLGYKRAVVKDLATHVYSNPFVTADRKMLMDRAKKFIL